MYNISETSWFTIKHQFIRAFNTSWKGEHYGNIYPLKEYLLSGAELEELCGIVCMEDILGLKERKYN